jgi:hypothetical protein
VLRDLERLRTASLAKDVERERIVALYARGSISIEDVDRQLDRLSREEQVHNDQIAELEGRLLADSTVVAQLETTQNLLSDLGERLGRLGADEGIDIRGVALLRASVDALDEPANEEEEATSNPVLEEQEWRIQCKRYQKIGASLMRTIVRETVLDPSTPPYGLVVAAACDVSAQTMAAFRDEARKCHVQEAHLWTKAQLEDMLFRPEWDNLLFAYFGISLGTRRRARLQEVRSRIALKRKLLRALKWDSIEHGSPMGVLISQCHEHGPLNTLRSKLPEAPSPTQCLRPVVNAGGEVDHVPV